MANENPGQSEIAPKLKRHAAKSFILFYMKDTSIFRNDEIHAYILNKEIKQEVLDSSLRVARHKETKYNGWYMHGIEYLSFGNPDQEQKDRYLFVDDYNLNVFEFSSEQAALEALEFNK